MIGIRATAQRLVEIVQGVTPKTLAHVPFRCLDPMDGAAVSLETAPPSDDRLFEIELGTPADDGEVGAPPLRQRVEGEVRVRYEMAGSGLARSVTQAEDAAAIRRALHTPIDWQTPSTGLDCISAYTAKPTQPIPPQDTDAPRHEIMAVPFFLIYREATE